MCVNFYPKSGSFPLLDSWKQVYTKAMSTEKGCTNAFEELKNKGVRRVHPDSHALVSGDVPHHGPDLQLAAVV